MQYLLLGLAVLTLGLLALNGFTRANPAVLARAIRTTGGVVALAAAAVLVVRGAIHYALGLAMLGSWLLSGSGVWQWGGFGGGQLKSSGQTSRVITDHLEMELEHDTGAMRGRVLKGVFQGRELESMAPAELAILWQDCRFADPQSAQLIEAYLDRVHASWREDMARAESQPGPGGKMTREEALEILGLEAGAGEEEIRRAHRELMLKLHPDRGGSSYLAAKINQAKDLLLGK
jgi:hypothetical protein